MYGYSNVGKTYIVTKISGKGDVQYRQIVRDSTIPEEDIMKAFCEFYRDELNNTCGFTAIDNISRTPSRNTSYSFYGPNDIHVFTMELISETF